MNKNLILFVFVTLLALSLFFMGNREIVTRSPATENADLELESRVFSEGGLTALPLISSGASPEETLGFKLFQDVKLSKDGAVACSSCHDLTRYGSDNRAFSIGIGSRIGDANAPTVFNSRFNFRQFWNGRATSLSEQVEGPIHNPKEMGMTWPSIISVIDADPEYRKDFQKVYGQRPSQRLIVHALVTFENQLITPNAPFDRYLRGDHSALTSYQLAGFRKFQDFGCIACHQGVNVGGNMFQTLGVMGDYFSDRGGSYESDVGRFAVTGKIEDMHVFRVPSLRNVAMTGPYFHDGQVKTLGRAVELMGKYQLGRSLSNEDVSDLVGFLDSLTGERPKILNELQKVK